MNKRKIIGIIIVVFGLIMVGGSIGSAARYGVAAPISMFLIVIVGIALIFWDKIKTWLS